MYIDGICGAIKAKDIDLKGIYMQEACHTLVRLAQVASNIQVLSYLGQKKTFGIFVDIIGYVVREVMKENVESLMKLACNDKHPLFQTILIVLLAAGPPQVKTKIYANAYLRETKLDTDLISILKGPKVDQAFPFFKLIQNLE